MNSGRRHWDAKGNPTLDLFGMIAYYHDDKESLRVVKSRPPHLYKVCPTIRISFSQRAPWEITIWKIFPGGQFRIFVIANKNALNSLRRLYANPRGGWTKVHLEDNIFFIHQGKVLPFYVQDELPAG